MSSRTAQHDNADNDLPDGAPPPTARSFSSSSAPPSSAGAATSTAGFDRDAQEHRKRLAMILRYLANMHRSSAGGQTDCFVRTFDGNEASSTAIRDAVSSECFVPPRSSSTAGDETTSAASSNDNGGGGVDGSIVFTLSDFRSLPMPEAGLFSSPPFSFYAASGGSSVTTSSTCGSENGDVSGVSVSWEQTCSSAGGSGSGSGGRRGQDFANMGGGSSSGGGGRWTVSAWSKAPSVPRGGGSSSSGRRHDDASSSTASCWLRLTRIKAEDPPPIASQSIRRYLETWAERKGVRSVRRLLHTADSLGHAPALDPSTPERKQQEIKHFLKRYRRHLRRDAVRRELEPLYNNLFELAQRTKSADASDELIWGFGSARMVLGGDEDGSGSTVVNGPLMEVRVEVELAPDGALLVRPCEHTGVEVNREVLAALATDGTAGADVLASLHKAVAEMETKYISPGQPSTYAPTLKRMAVELCSGGRFLPSNRAESSITALSNVRRRGGNKLLVTDSWCCFHRPKPSSVWARDAQTLAELIAKSGSGSFESSPPRAALSLTHGSNALSRTETNDNSLTGCVLGSLKTLLSWTNATSTYGKEMQRPLFPLPTSKSQERIHRLLSSGAPAVVVEGPPGCGKTHSIANIVCSYLAQGKRVLVTSKGAPALSVLRQRLPECMQELCVDATVSEAAGMQQLQRTVERLADRVSCGVDKTALCESLEVAIKELEQDIAKIDKKLEQYHDRKNALLQKAEGQELTDAAFSVVAEAPWMAATMTEWSASESSTFTEKVEKLVNERDVGFDEVSGYTSPPSNRLISGVAAKTGAALPSISGTTVRTMAAVPILGSFSGARSYQDDVDNDLEQISIFGEAPTTKSDWEMVLRAINHDKEHWRLYDDHISKLVDREGWPKDSLYDGANERLSFNEIFVEILQKASRSKEIEDNLLVPSDLEHSQESQKLEVQRSKMIARLQDMDGKLVEAKVITKLSKMFSPEAQSALIKFAQLAGKAKFKSNAQASRLSQRQQRHRQEYLKAFEQCVRYIPCWILTTNQVNDYLPAEFGLFDVAIIDEASQSDITALPSMLRGKQWLIVGDGKQVSPTESFVSEDQIDSLRVSLPESPFRGCFLPGHSFFDLCAQAYPTNRVVLSEHFRSAPEIISFSNSQYYNGRLHPLRLPTSDERMNPSLVDIFLRNGRKVGKVNENECNKIVDMIKTMVDEGKMARARPKSIGVICLVGDEQSRLIRGRLLDSVGAQAYNDHDILVGTPPSFQGSERDVIFLSMVSSQGSVPTQSQLMHHQRANVALSRARDRLVLVRSIGRSHVPSTEDVKIPIIEFFSEYGAKDIVESDTSAVGRNNEESNEVAQDDDMAPLRDRIMSHLSGHLRESGFTVSAMGVVWSNGVCVENGNTGSRAAIAIEGCGELKEEWSSSISQQRSIERVGWQCLRVDALSWMLNHRRTVYSLEMFLKSAGVGKPVVDNMEDDVSADASEENFDDAGGDIINENINEERQEKAPVIEIEDEAPLDLNRVPSQRANAIASDDVVVISSNEDEDYIEVSSNASSFDAVKDEDDEGFQPNQYGDIVNLEIIGSAVSSGGSRAGQNLHAESSDSESESSRPRKKSAKRKSSDRTPDEDYHGDESDHGDESEGVDDNGERRGNMKRRKRSKRRKLDSHSRDGRWYPGYAPAEEDDAMDAEDEDWEDLKDVMSDESVGSGNGAPSENLRSRPFTLRADPASQLVHNSGEQPTGSEDFQDCAEEEVDGGIDVKANQETAGEAARDVKPEALEERQVGVPNENNNVISLL